MARNRVPYQTRLIQKARTMRHHPTKAEAIFRDRLIKAGIVFQSQAVIGRYIADFLIPQLLLVIELEGGVHQRPRKIAYDQKRTAFLESVGFKVLRIPNAQAETYKFKAGWYQAKRAGTRRCGAALKRANAATLEMRMLDKQANELLEWQSRNRQIARSRDLTPRLVKVKAS